MKKMNSDNRHGNPYVAAGSSLLGKPVDHLGHGVKCINFNSAKGDAQWKVYSNKSNKKEAAPPKNWAPRHINSKPQYNAGGSWNLRPTLGCDNGIPIDRGNAGHRAYNKGPGPWNSQMDPTQAIHLPQQHGKNWVHHQSQVGLRKHALSVKSIPADIEDDDDIEDEESDDVSDNDSNQLDKKCCEEAFGKWNGLAEIKDREIVWPPMVIIMNTILDKDANENWIGMGKQELLDYFSTYAATKARHSYGPLGHRGTSVLIFNDSAIGYLGAERLHKHFEDHGTDRDAWDHRRKLFCPDGKRQLYGFMARKEDLDFFNHGKTKLKYELRSYLENVVYKVKQMNEDNQQFISLKGEFVKEQRISKELEQSFCLVSEKLQKTMKEIRIERERTKMQHEQLKEEMDSLEQFYNDQIQNIHKEMVAKEDNFESMQQKECEEAKLSKKSDKTSSSMEDHRAEEVAILIKCLDKEIDFVTMREKLMKIHSEKKAAMKKRHGEEELELEKEFDVELNNLMEQYTPQTRDKTRRKLTSAFARRPFWGEKIILPIFVKGLAQIPRIWFILSGVQ